MGNTLRGRRGKELNAKFGRLGDEALAVLIGHGCRLRPMRNRRAGCGDEAIELRRCAEQKFPHIGATR